MISDMNEINETFDAYVRFQLSIKSSIGRCMKPTTTKLIISLELTFAALIIYLYRIFSTFNEN